MNMLWPAVILIYVGNIASFVTPGWPGFVMVLAGAVIVQIKAQNE